MNLKHFLFAFAALLSAAAVHISAQATRPGRDDAARPNDVRRNIPDFSTCGYAAGEQEIPHAGVCVVVPPRAGDNTARIQAAIDHVASLPSGEDGLRGAVLLEKGRHEVRGGLKISASGVVLRGSGHETELVAAGTDRRTLISIVGTDDRASGGTIAIAGDVAANATQFRFAGESNLKVGDEIEIRRPATGAWIKSLGMDDMGGDRHGFSWKPGTRDLVWLRVITGVDGDSISVDAPITCAIEGRFGGGSVGRVDWPGRISNVGIENLTLISAFDEKNRQDEDHAWFAITIENARDVWVRQVTTKHFTGGAVAVWETGSRIAVEDVMALDPIGEIGGWRRHSFFTAGQQTQFKHCYAEHGRHDFAVGHAAAGPNAFVQCEADNAHADSGPIDSVAAGVLYDHVRIDGAPLSLMNRQYHAAGAGWSAFNCVLWNCSAAVINNFAPPGAQNWAFGTWGEFAGDGVWNGSNGYVEPLSLFEQQLRNRLGEAAARRLDIMQIEPEASSSPTPEKAAELTAAAKQPAPTIRSWIATAAERKPISIDASGAKSIDEIWSPPDLQLAAKRPLAIADGRLTIDGAPISGKKIGTPWWRGGIRPHDIAAAPPAITRFVPGRHGRGATDNLQELAESLRANNVAAIEQHPPLWYDRRRDDHQRVRRADGDVLPPFFETPFARSGQGVAWDGLSKFDLTKYNPFYFDRLRQFADLADVHGLILIQNHYFQHSILEAGAHYADFPWRTANNINDSGFPEPPPYAGDKRIFMAEQFYDVTNSARRDLHRAYIRKHLDNFAANTNVIHLTSDEYTGPLHFAQFWLDTIADWQKETGKGVVVGLSATKDVQDAILADATRAAVIDVIDIRYWWYQSDGSLYAPPGGKNLAPRQWMRVLKPKPPTRESARRAVEEYRQKHPDKAVMYSVEGGEGRWPNGQ